MTTKQHKLPQAAAAAHTFDAAAAHPRTGPQWGEQAMTSARRQRAYRLRRKRAVTQAIGEETQASRVTLLELLSRDLAALEDNKTATSMHQAVRNSAKRVLLALVTRYGINLTGES
jgi:hypothetical protein